MIRTDTDDQTALDIAGTVCVSCHSTNGGPSDPPAVLLGRVNCTDAIWKSHVFDGRLSEKVWEFITETETGGSTCGW